MAKREFWTPARIKEFGHVVGAYNTIIRRLNKMFDGTGVRLPLEVVASEERAWISNYAQYHKRIKQLKRLSKSVKADAQDVVEVEPGIKMIKYLKRELTYAKSSLNERREKKRKELYPDWDTMTPIKKAIAKTSSNIDKVETPVSEMDGEDLKNMHHEINWEVLDYFTNYLDAWALWHRTYEGYEVVRNIVIRFYDEKPWELEKILDGPDPEKDIEYLYITEDEAKQELKNARARYIHKKFPSSPDLTPAYIKRRNVLNFWTEMHIRYF